MTKEKLYEVNGIIEYAHCFREEIMAKTSAEAKKKVEEKLNELSNSADAEFQGGIVDLGIEIKN